LIGMNLCLVCTGAQRSWIVPRYNPPLYPDTIILFQEPLERMCETIEELEEQIEITVVHEIAHFLGITEERLAELGYG
jgi:predicted Zn-dependent protease with MMP-like domain